ncbi:hypothetical protein I6B53_10675 [Schaalia sp. 19OD2882]|uniref:hypothetical protein n=1 Tax=Schaalia sp. 19OD2882 TaxID=2794089 RepID=UPI001C1EE223|nr:hypothetical protein [Schaalia sp. 19OD2882]QWW19521.1 hypothetical protein I6B53_10675 [Schaalia sp. 19OD2882]
MTTFGTVTLAFEDAPVPTPVAVHTMPPLPGKPVWKADVQRVVDFAAAHDGPQVHSLPTTGHPQDPPAE